MKVYVLKLRATNDKSYDRLLTVVEPAMNMAFEEVETDADLAYLVPEEKREAVERFLERTEFYQETKFVREWKEVNHV